MLSYSKVTIISFAYCSFNTFKFKGFNMSNSPKWVVVGEGGGSNWKFGQKRQYWAWEPCNPLPEGGKVGAFEAGVLKGDFVQLLVWLYYANEIFVPTVLSQYPVVLSVPSSTQRTQQYSSVRSSTRAYAAVLSVPNSTQRTQQYSVFSQQGWV